MVTVSFDTHGERHGETRGLKGIDCVTDTLRTIITVDYDGIVQNVPISLLDVAWKRIEHALKQTRRWT
jgi:hypothetical protein